MSGKRGFIFTLDSLFAVGLIVLAGSVLFLTLPNMEGSAVAYESAAIKAHDRAVVDFYLGIDSAGGTFDQNRFASCVEYVRYADAVSGTLDTYTVCEGVE